MNNGNKNSEKECSKQCALGKATRCTEKKKKHGNKNRRVKND